MIEICEVKASDYLDQAEELIRMDQAELEGHLQAEPHINRELFAVCEASGGLRTLAVFDGEIVVGYCNMLIFPHMHYDLLASSVTAMYLHPEYRRGRIGIKLIRAAEDLSRAAGAAWLTWSVKPNTPMAALLDKWSAYHIEDVNYIRRLDNGD